MLPSSAKPDRNPVVEVHVSGIIRNHRHVAAVASIRGDSTDAVPDMIHWLLGGGLVKSEGATCRENDFLPPCRGKLGHAQQPDVDTSIRRHVLFDVVIRTVRVCVIHDGNAGSTHGVARDYREHGPAVGAFALRLTRNSIRVLARRGGDRYR